MSHGSAVKAGRGFADPCYKVDGKTAVIVMTEDWDRETKPSPGGSYVDGTEGGDPWSKYVAPGGNACTRWGNDTNGSIYIENESVVLDDYSEIWNIDSWGTGGPHCIVFSLNPDPLGVHDFDPASRMRTATQMYVARVSDGDWNCWCGDLMIGWYPSEGGLFWEHQVDADGTGNDYEVGVIKDLYSSVWVRWENTARYSRVKIWGVDQAEPETWTSTLSGGIYFWGTRSLYFEHDGSWADDSDADDPYPSAIAIGPISIAQISGTNDACDQFDFANSWYFYEPATGSRIVRQGTSSDHTGARPRFDYRYTFPAYNLPGLIFQSRTMTAVVYKGFIPNATYRLTRKMGVMGIGGGWPDYFQDGSIPVYVKTFNPDGGNPGWDHNGIIDGAAEQVGTWSYFLGDLGCEWWFQIETPWGPQDWYICGQDVGIPFNDDPRLMTVSFSATASGSGRIGFAVTLPQYDDWENNVPNQGNWGCSAGSFTPGCGPQRTPTIRWETKDWRFEPVVAQSPKKCQLFESVPSVGGGSATQVVGK